MDNLETLVENYLEYCSTQKCLDAKTLKAYRIDLRQFSEQTFPHEVTEITSKTLEDYIAKLAGKRMLNQQLNTRTTVAHARLQIHSL